MFDDKTQDVIMDEMLDQADPMRFDVLAIDGEEIMHIKNAFETY